MHELMVLVMAIFQALPVKQGDAFLLKTKAVTVLVDGGNNSSTFPSIFQKHACVDSLDKVVCTHNDSDHTNGLLGLLRDDVPVSEVWLPASIMDVLPDVLKPLEDVIFTIASDLAAPDTEFPAPEDVGFDEYGVRLSLGEFGGPLEFEDVDGGELSANGYAEDWSDGLFEFDYWVGPLSPALDFPYLIEELPSPVKEWFREEIGDVWASFEDRLFPYFWEALKAADRIRKLAKAAFDSGIDLRWFEYDIGSPGGGEDYLAPVNSREVFRIRRRRGTLVARLASGTCNEDSLVFFSPRKQTPGVLFCADHDLTGVDISKHNLKGAVVTVPHHGSSKNVYAYELLKEDANPRSLRMVRSDCKSTKRPCSDYVGMPSNKACTVCNGQNGLTGRQRVDLHSVGPSQSSSTYWRRSRNVRECCCTP